MTVKVRIARLFVVAAVFVFLARATSLAAEPNALVSHWRFDEAEGTVAHDSAGTNHGTIHGATWTTGIIGGALDFDGDEDYVEIPDDDSLTPRDEITIAFWVYNRGGQTAGIYKYAGCPNEKYSPGNSRAYAIRGIGDTEPGTVLTIFSSVRTSDQIVSNSVVALNEWHHITGSFDRGNAAIYVDGQLDNTRTMSVSSIMNDAQPLIIGGHWDYCGTDNFVSRLNGIADDVRIYNRALSAEEVEQLYQYEAGPVAHWKFDESEGDITYDSAGSNHGTIHGAAWTTGIIDGALDFDGVDDYVSVPYADVFQVSTFTIMAWVYPTADLSLQSGAIVGRGEDRTNDRAWGGLAVAPEESSWGHGIKITYEDNVDGDYFYDTGFYPPVETWTHLVVTRSAERQLRIYKDGDLLKQWDSTPTPATNCYQDLTIGAYWQKRSAGMVLGDFFPGSIDDVRVYGRALSAEEVQQLAQVEPPDVTQTYYVNAVDGSDLNDGSSLQTAFATIQKGIDAAEDGDTVLVYPAVYSEPINFDGKAITLQGVATADGVPVIETPGAFAVSFLSGEDANSILKNFVIKNSSVGIFLADASPTIANLTFVDDGKGIAAYGYSNPDIHSCIFWNNTDDLYQCEARYSWVEEDINEPSYPTEGLISRWKFDEGEGTTAFDSAGNNDGTLVNGPVWTTGQVGGALEFDGRNDYVAGSSSPFDFEDTTFSLSVWFKTRGIINEAMISEGGIEGGWHISLPYAGHVQVMLKRKNSTTDALSVVTEDAYNDGKWHHAAAVIKTSTTDALQNSVSVHVDGVPCQLIEIHRAYPYGACDDNWRIGAKSPVIPRYFDGTIDEVAIYDRALTAEEIEAMYKVGLAGHEFGPLFADADNYDYRLLSERGRFWPAHEVWVLDDVTSPCIDGGDPAANPSSEPMPNGGRINMGAYGGTAYASMSEWLLPADMNRDGRVNANDFAILAAAWLEEFAWLD